MKRNPCMSCRMLDKDKNNKLCLNCKKRVGYLQQLEQELNFSITYTNTGLYEPISYAMEFRLTGKFNKEYIFFPTEKTVLHAFGLAIFSRFPIIYR